MLLHFGYEVVYLEVDLSVRNLPAVSRQNCSNKKCYISKSLGIEELQDVCMKHSDPHHIVQNNGEKSRHRTLYNVVRGEMHVDPNQGHVKRREVHVITQDQGVA
jgi:hypothetical protein